MRSWSFSVVIATLALLAGPALASASTLTRSGGTYTYTGSGSANLVDVAWQNPAFVISDSENITMAADASCDGENTTFISCSVAPTSLNVDAGGGPDVATVLLPNLTTIPLVAQGGAGNDSFELKAHFTGGAPATATLDDSAGDDVLKLDVSTTTGAYGTVGGGPGNDTVSGTGVVNGGANNDVLLRIPSTSNSVTFNGGSEDDTVTMTDNAQDLVSGGPGQDTVDYRGSSSALNVTLDTVANDGDGPIPVDNANADGSVEIVRTGSGADSITGSNNNDLLFAGAGNDSLNGGSGDDFLDGEAGADGLNGGANGAGGDTVDYSERPGRVRVTIEGVANDGEGGEHDNVNTDIENVNAGFGDDSVTGSAGPNSINGGPGDDSLDGLDGADAMVGGSGNDTIDGGNQNDGISAGRGDDTVDGGLNADVINGDGGADLLDGSAGFDTINGNAGSDTLLSKDGLADTINCGDATDHAVTDLSGDTVGADCEISDTGSAGFGGPGATPVGAVGGSVPGAVVTCVPRRGKQRRVLVQCTVALKHPKRGRLHAVLWRGDRPVAYTSRPGSGSLTLRTARRAKRGRYRVELRQHGRDIAQVPLRVR